MLLLWRLKEGVVQRQYCDDKREFSALRVIYVFILQNVVNGHLAIYGRLGRIYLEVDSLADRSVLCGLNEADPVGNDEKLAKVDLFHVEIVFLHIDGMPNIVLKFGCRVHIQCLDL